MQCRLVGCNLADLDHAAARSTLRRQLSRRPCTAATPRATGDDRPVALRELRRRPVALGIAPIVSYLIQRGRCRQCGGRIAPAHLAIELAATLVAAWAATTDTDPGWLWADCALGWTLLALAWIDWVHLRLPDALTLPLVLGGLGATALLDPAETTGHALAAAIGYAAFRLIARGYRALRGREGLGTGDAKLLAASGAWVGVAGLSPVVLAAAVAGLVVAVVRTGRGRAAERHHDGSVRHMPGVGDLAGAALWLTGAAAGPP